MTDTNAGPVLPLPQIDLRNLVPSTLAYGRQCWNACDEQVAGPLRKAVAAAQEEYLLLVVDRDSLRERVAELERTCEKRSMAFDMCSRSRQKKVDEITRLRAECAECEKNKMDAERYRFIRKNGGVPLIGWDSADTWQEQDAAIDAARAARESK